MRKAAFYYRLPFLGHLWISKNDYEEARLLYRESLAISHETRNQEMVAVNLVGLPSVALGIGKKRYAIRLVNAPKKIRDAFNLFGNAIDECVYERTSTAINSELRRTKFNATWAKGQELTLDQVVATAMNV